MMKIDALIVVEGKSDIDYLSSFIDSTFYLVNGSSVNKNDFDFINENIKRGKIVIILTDPDYPGLRIRNLINENCPGCKNAYVRKEFSIKRHKVGVAECDKDEIIYALNNFVSYNQKEIGTITAKDLYDLGLTSTPQSKEKRDKIIEKYHLGYSNFKTILKKLNMLNISLDEIKETLKDAND